MKKNYSLLKPLVLSLVVFCCAIFSMTAEELVLGRDYSLSLVFGENFCSCDPATGEIKFATGSKNSNNAVLFELTDPKKIVAGHNIVVSYEITEVDKTQDAQIVIQPRNRKGADYSKGSYPIIFFKDNPDNTSSSFTVDCDNLLKSSVKKDLIGFNICSNGGGKWEKFVWQDKFSFKITKVEIVKK